MATNCHFVLEHGSDACRRCVVTQFTRTLDHSALFGLPSKRRGGTLPGCVATEVPSHRDISNGSQLVWSKTPGAHPGHASELRSTKGSSGRGCGREVGPEAQGCDGGGETRLQAESYGWGGGAWQEFGLGVRPGRRNGFLPEAALGEPGREENARGDRERASAAPAVAEGGSISCESDSCEQGACTELRPEGSGLHGTSEVGESKEENEAEGEEEVRTGEAKVGRVIDELMALFESEIPQRLNHHTSATRELLPLPVLDWSDRSPERLLLWRGERNEEWDEALVHHTDRWLGLVVRTLNVQVQIRSSWWHPRAPQSEALRLLWLSCYDFLADGLEVSSEDWRAYLSHHKIDYNGEVAMVAQQLTWARVEPALPPPSNCAVLSAEQVCTGAALHYLERPEDALCDHPEQHLERSTARVHIAVEERVCFARELLKRRLVTVVRADQVLRVNGKAILNGLFGVEKPGQMVRCPDGQTRAAQRLIMNLQPVNALMKKFAADTGTLPLMARMRSLVVESDAVLENSFEDMRGCFYLIRLRAAWARYFTFNVAFTAAELEIEGEEGSTESYYIGAQVIPMGWCNAVGLVQSIHKRLLCANELARPWTAGLPVSREVRSDKPLPVLSLRGVGTQRAWQVYIDDFDTMELVAATDEKCCELNSWQAAAREVYDSWSLPTSREKAGIRERRCTRLGLSLDGELARLAVPTKKVGKLLGLTLHALRSPVSQKHFQVILGHWVHAMMVRRECMSVFDQCWKVLLRLSRRPMWLPQAARSELVQALCLLPVMSCYLRSAVDPRLTASDASECGGGVCVTTGVTEEGLIALQRGQVTQGSLGRDELGLLTFGDGVGSAQLAALRLGLDLSFTLAWVSNAAAVQLLEASFKRCKACSDWLELPAALSCLLSASPHVSRILVIALTSDLAQQVYRSMGQWRVAHPWLHWSVLWKSPDGNWLSTWQPPVLENALELRPDMTPAELEHLLELPEGHTIPILSKRDREIFKNEFPFLRIALLREGVCVSVLVQMLRSWVREVALAGTPGDRSWHSNEPAMDLARALFTLTSHRGSDVRFDAQAVVDPRAGPWHSLLPSWWFWRVVLAFRLGGLHINCLELQAIWAAIRWRLRRKGMVGSRFLHATDSQVCLAVLVKGRTSSAALSHTLRKINATLLAGSLLPHWTYVSTDCNPADKPSRWLRE
eukprot:384841-Amphidinium_carterae.2